MSEPFRDELPDHITESLIDPDFAKAWAELAHPRHVLAAKAGIWDVAFPIHPRGWLGWKTRRSCRKRGGHYWHAADSMVLEKCCTCGAARDA